MKLAMTVFLIMFSANMAWSTTPQTLEELDQYIYKNFHSQFALGQTAYTQYISCFGDMPCDDLLRKEVVTNMSDDKLQTTIYKRDGKAIKRVNLSEKTWIEKSGNIVRFLIQNMNSYGYTHSLEEISPATHTLTVNGESQTVTGYLVKLAFLNRLGNTVKHHLIVSNELPGIGQRLWSKEWKQFNTVDSHILQSIEY